MRSGNLNILILILTLVSCGTKKGVVKSSGTTCDTQVTVRDYTGLDGCRFLLELKDGTRLIPVELADPTFLFSEGQIIKIKYTSLKDVVTACLTAAIPVRVTCLEEIKPGIKAGQEFLKRDCIDTETPLGISWMNKLVIRNEVTEVKKGYLHADPYYVFVGNVNVMIFNCKGDLACEYEKNTKSSCEAKYSILNDLKSVWAQK
jgi:hypothetical protein